MMTLALGYLSLNDQGIAFSIVCLSVRPNDEVAKFKVQKIDPGNADLVYGGNMHSESVCQIKF